MASPEEVVDSFYAALFRRDFTAAKSYLAAGAMYHAASPFHEWRGDHQMTTYVDEIAPRSLDALQDYRVEALDRDVLDDLLVTRLPSSWTDATEPGGRKRAAGLAIFRVAGGEITDLWSINAAGRDETAGF